MTSILELNASAGAYVERSGALGLTEGTYDLREEGLCRLAYLEEIKTLPFGIVWDAYCESQNVPTGDAWLAETKKYEAEVTLNR